MDVVLSVILQWPGAWSHRAALLTQVASGRQNMFSQEPESDADSAEDEFRSLGSFRSSDELETSMEDAGAPGLAHVPSCTDPGHYVAAGHPVSSHTRTLYHPTFEAYYTTVAALQKEETPQMQIQREQGIFINNGGYFYTDPLQPPGHRVYNFLSPQTYNMFGIFRLVTPPPIMSPGIFVPNLEVLQSSADPNSAVPEEASEPPELILSGESKAITPGSPSAQPSREAVPTTESAERTSDTSGRSLSEPAGIPGSGRSLSESVCAEESGRSVSESMCTEENGRSLSEPVGPAESGRSFSKPVCPAESGRSLSEPVCPAESGRSLSEPVCPAESGRSLSKPVCVPIGVYRDSPYTLSELEAVSGLLHLSGSCPPSGGQ